MKKQYNYTPITQFTVDGRQPPADVNGEEYLLGCILSESGAINRAGSITSDTFYSEQNKAIFMACKRLQNKGSVISNISVSRELTADERAIFTDTPELYLYGITGKIGVTTDLENTVLHLKDVSAKREMVLSALKTITDIDELDPLDSLTIGKDRFTEIENTIFSENSFQKYIVRRDSSYDNPEPILFRGEDEILHLKDVQMLEGQPGSRKTFAISAMIAGLLGSDPEKCLGFSTNKELTKVLLIDTEQAGGNVNKVAKRVHKMAGLDTETEYSNFTVIGLRECYQQERLMLTIKAIEFYKPDVVFIDNGKDLIANFNDLEESGKVITTLMRIASKNNCAICTVIHQNWGTTKAKGHLGSLLKEKVSLSMQLKVVGDTTEIKYDKVRNAPPQQFAFMINQMTLLPELTEIIEKTAKADKLSIIFNRIMQKGKIYPYMDLVRMYMKSEDKGESWAKKQISTANKSCVIEQHEGKTYSLTNNDIEDEDEAPF